MREYSALECKSMVYRALPTTFSSQGYSTRSIFRHQSQYDARNLFVVAGRAAFPTCDFCLYSTQALFPWIIPSANAYEWLFNQHRVILPTLLEFNTSFLLALPRIRNIQIFSLSVVLNVKITTSEMLKPFVNLHFR